ncbi:MAG: DMT family transporter [Bacteroidaceae bacterium]|nr:DMT family transporter [Bacteroidaceae bacterium]
MRDLPFYKHTDFVAIMACALWGTAFVGIKIGLQYNTPLQFAGVRFTLAGLMILPFVKDFKLKWKVSMQHWRVIILIAFLQTTLLYALFYWGLARVPASIGAMLGGASPLFIALVAHFGIRNDKMTKYKLYCILMGLFGVIIISLNKTSADGILYPAMGLGIVFLLLNNITAGFGNVAVAKYGDGLPPMMLSSLSLIIGGFTLWLVSFLFEDVSLSLNRPVAYYLALLWLSFLSAAAITMWYTLLRRPGVKVSQLGTWKFIIPILGACLSWIILPDESPNLLSLIGMIFIAASLILINRKRVK